MKLKKLVLATAMIGSLGGMYGCSEGDDTSIAIDAPTTTTTGGTGGTGGTGVSTCPSWVAAARAQTSDGTNVCQLPNEILVNRTLTNDIIWFIGSRVVVGNGNGQVDVTNAAQNTLQGGDPILNVTLTIEAGTQIKASAIGLGDPYLIISRGSDIMAQGTANAPIVFSSEDDDFDGSGEWGGIVITGFGSHNDAACQAPNVACNIAAESAAGFQGGVGLDNDNSGVLSYVIIAEGGIELSIGDEINGLSLQTVGSGTTINNIQVHNNLDDGVEFYGGSVNVKNLVLTGNLDDSIDWDEGYVGNIQYAIVRQAAGTEGNGIEADTQGAAMPFSIPTLVNATFIADGDEPEVFQLKEGTGGFIHNSIITTATGNAIVANCVQVSGAEAQANRNIRLAVNNLIGDCADAGTGAFGDAVLDTTTVSFVEAALDASYASTAPEAELGAPIDFTAFAGVFAESTADATFLDATDYLGAVEPGTPAASAWWAGWIIEGSL